MMHEGIRKRGIKKDSTKSKKSWTSLGEVL
jgi:hypothetical protein